MRIFVVDAFTDRAFTGNPAGVVLLSDEAVDDAADGAVEDGWMQSVAAELRHSETAFVRGRPDGTYDLRWFTPAVEVDLCGHATLATAHALASTAAGPFTFHTRSGALHATVGGDGAISLDFPAQPPHPAATPEHLPDALRVRAVGVHTNGTDVLVELGSADEVARLDPDLALLRSVEARGVCVTACGDTAGGDGADFVSRFFAPRVAVDEDPVTGSAHCMLAPFWAHRLGRDTLTGRQLSARGGTVRVTVRDDRVHLRGHAVTVLRGELLAR